MIKLSVFAALVVVPGWLVLSDWAATVWSWETRLTSYQQAVRLSVHRDVQSLALEYVGADTALDLSVALSYSVVKEFWLAGPESGTVKGEIPCVGADAPKTPGAPRCILDRAGFRVDLDLAAVSRDKAWLDVWIIPSQREALVQQGMPVVRRPPSAVHWTKLTWKVSDALSAAPREGSAKAADCAESDVGRARPSCHMAGVFLNGAEPARLPDPQQSTADLAKRLARRFVPYVVHAMLGVDAVLLGCIVWLLTAALFSGLPIKRWREWTVGDSFDETVRRLSGKGADDLAAMPLLGPVEAMNRGFRALLEWLEVVGPGLGFLLTVVALLIAFDPAVFAERDVNRFAGAISTAMAATFAGLGMRILAFSADRLLDVVQRRGGKTYGVDAYGHVYQKSVGTTTPSPDKSATDTAQPTIAPAPADGEAKPTQVNGALRPPHTNGAPPSSSARTIPGVQP
ncbi:MAG: hypothetical protein QM820_29505 [Minicystis sp.]